MARLLFEKVGDSIFMSHLDLMRVFQRAFQRAGLPLKHTQGYNPRPSVSIALPLSVGVESLCELLDFDLEGVSTPNDEILSRLNNALVKGVRVLEVYNTGKKLRELATLSCRITFEYDKGVPTAWEKKVGELFARESLMVEKKSKNGLQCQDIIPMIKSFRCAQTGENSCVLEAVICCQNPSLNPTQLVAAIKKEYPELSPDFSKCCRLEIYDRENQIFR